MQGIRSCTQCFLGPDPPVPKKRNLVAKNATRFGQGAAAAYAYLLARQQQQLPPPAAPLERQRARKRARGG